MWSFTEVPWQSRCGGEGWDLAALTRGRRGEMPAQEWAAVSNCPAVAPGPRQLARGLVSGDDASTLASEYTPVGVCDAPRATCSGGTGEFALPHPLRGRRL